MVPSVARAVGGPPTAPPPKVTACSYRPQYDAPVRWYGDGTCPPLRRPAKRRRGDTRTRPGLPRPTPGYPHGAETTCAAAGAPLPSPPAPARTRCTANFASATARRAIRDRRLLFTWRAAWALTSPSPRMPSAETINSRLFAHALRFFQLLVQKKRLLFFPLDESREHDRHNTPDWERETEECLRRDLLSRQ